jgi:hypothetical protein
VLGALIWFAFGALAVLGGLEVRRKARASMSEGRTSLDDEAIRRIMETGSLHVDDDPPLDMEEIQEEEERFWSERWDEPEEW